MNFKNISKLFLSFFLLYLGFEVGLNLDFNQTENDISQKAYVLKKERLIEKGLNRKGFIESNGYNNKEKHLFIIGDSYMDNLFQFGEHSYSNMFDKFSESINYKFVDLSKSGSNFDYFDETLNNLFFENSILVYSFFIHDFSTLKNKKEMPTSKIIEENHFQFLGIKVLKNIIQQISMYIFKTPIPTSQTYIDFMEWDETSRQIFEKHILNIKSRFNKVYLIVNFPFNFKYGNNKFQSMDFLDSLSSDNLSVFFSNEIVKNPRSTGFIDGHPSMDTVIEIFEFIKKEILNDIDD